MARDQSFTRHMTRYEYRNNSECRHITSWALAARWGTETFSPYCLALFTFSSYEAPTRLRDPHEVAERFLSTSCAFFCPHSFQVKSLSKSDELRLLLIPLPALACPTTLFTARRQDRPRLFRRTPQPP